MISSNKQLFLQYVGQTSLQPIGLEIVKANGIFLFSAEGQRYIDLASGVSVNNLGHNHPKIVKAVTEQANKYMHLMVYGEYVESPQVRYAKMLSHVLPDKLNNVYFVNSGSEAIEGALKLAKRHTNRTEIVAFENAYHGSTHGALSVGHEKLKNAFRPLLPGIRFLKFNCESDLKKISEKTACVIIEPIQAEAGIILPKKGFLKKLEEICKNHGALLIFDEVQTGFGRTGKLFAFEQYNVVPDVLVIAKAMGGGMPIGAFVSDKRIMQSLTHHPELGHITTFGGHPVSAAAACANLEILHDEKIVESVHKKGDLFVNLLKNHPKIKEIRGTGLFYAVDLHDKKAFLNFMKWSLEKGLVTDPFLFYKNSFRIAPPLIISKKEIKNVCEIIIEVLDKI